MKSYKHISNIKTVYNVDSVDKLVVRRQDLSY